MVAAKLSVAPSTFPRLLSAKSSVTPEMGLRLSVTLGRSPESWLAMQNAYDLWQLRRQFNMDTLEPLTSAG